MKEQNKILPISKTAEEILSEVFQRDTPEIPHSDTLFGMILSAMDEYKNQDGFPCEMNVGGFRGKFQGNEDAEAFKERCIYYQNKYTEQSSLQPTIEEEIDQLIEIHHAQDADLKEQFESKDKRIKELEEALRDILNALQKEHDNSNPIRRSVILSGRMSRAKALLNL